MTTAIAIHKLRLADPSGDMVHTGRFNASGDAIMTKSSRVVLSGQFFDLDDKVGLDELIALGAARLPTPEEIALRELATEEN